MIGSGAGKLPGAAEFMDRIISIQCGTCIQANQSETREEIMCMQVLVVFMKVYLGYYFS